MRTGSPDLMIAMRLLDQLKLGGFQFWRAAPGEDGPLVGKRVTGDWADTVRIEGFSCDCFAWRKRISSLIVYGEGLVERRIDGSALTVLKEVLTWEIAHGTSAVKRPDPDPDGTGEHSARGALRS